jgi:RimJ/RimL family protein N-acetyltransferase
MIRLLRRDDLKIFKNLRLEALRLEPESFASSAKDWENFSDDEWSHKLVEAEVFAAFKGNDAIGVAALTRHRGAKTSHRATVGMVYVRKQMRGAGHATALMKAVIAQAREAGVQQLELTVSGANPAAIRFYAKEGFSEVGRIPAGFIHNGTAVDDVLMVRQHI